MTERLLLATGSGIVNRPMGGQTWRAASAGLSVPWPHHMVERFFQIENELLAVLSSGELWAAALPALSWRSLLPQVTRVAAAAWLQP